MQRTWWADLERDSWKYWKRKECKNYHIRINILLWASFPDHKYLYIYIYISSRVWLSCHFPNLCGACIICKHRQATCNVSTCVYCQLSWCQSHLHSLVVYRNWNQNQLRFTRLMWPCISVHIVLSIMFDAFKRSTRLKLSFETFWNCICYQLHVINITWSHITNPPTCPRAVLKDSCQAGNVVKKKLTVRAEKIKMAELLEILASETNRISWKNAAEPLRRCSLRLCSYVWCVSWECCCRKRSQTQHVGFARCGDVWIFLGNLRRYQSCPNMHNVCRFGIFLRGQCRRSCRLVIRTPYTAV